MTALHTTTTRRGFLRLAGRGGLVGATAAFASVARLRAVPAWAAPDDVAPGADGPGEASPGFFSDGERELLAQIVERMVDTGEPAAPRVRDTRALVVIERIAAGLDPAVSGQLPLALRLFEYGPLVFELSFSRFSRMSDAEKDASLRAWMTSRLAIRRQAFLALRNLALLGYWSQPETWPLIGYRGPLLAAGASR